MRNDGGPAFPGDTRVVDHVEREQLGMSLRDYFAAHAINSLKLRINASDIKMLNVSDLERDERYSIIAPLHARYAYAIADAMLAERSKKESD